MKKLCMLVMVMLIATAGVANARDLRFEVSLDKSQVAIGTAAKLGLSFYGTQSIPAPDLGNIDGLEVRYMGPSTMMTVLNGQVSSSITHMYSVLPLRLGKFQLGPFAFTYKADEYKSNMIFLDVTETRPVVPKAIQKQDEAMPEKLDMQDRVFLTLEAAKQVAYVNELIPITVKFYVNRMNVSDIQLPVFAQESFSKIEFKEPKQYKENMNGALYDVLEFSTSIFGTKPGDYKLGPATIKANVVVRRRTARPSSGDPFSEDFTRDSFFDDFFTRYERHPVELKSQDVQISVLPVPAQGRPANFSGAVGDYQFIYAASPTKLKAGDPVTLRMEINGTGNLNTVLMPNMAAANGFKTYEPQVKTGEHSKSFTQVLIPENENVTEIPKAEFSFFDPAKKDYVTISRGPIQIQVEKPKEEAPSQVIGPAEEIQKDRPRDELGRDLVYIKELPGRWRRVDYQVYKNGFLVPFMALPLGILIFLAIARGRADRLRRDTAYASKLNSVKSAKAGLKSLKRLLRSKDEKAFYEALFITLQGYLGHKLRIPPAGVTSDVVEGILSMKNIDVDILAIVVGLFRACDEARFAMSQKELIHMSDDLKRLEEAINYLERKKVF
ncbi:MAG: BatD family protein [Candidatus Omnitrophica bacterium]|nr:BatD family protein [Candidatus Omnitrophota bacterium]